MTKSRNIGRGGARKGAGRKSKKSIHIKVFKWESAPNELKALSHHGGDEDWIALVPFVWANEYISWLESGSGFGCCDVSEHVHPDYPNYQIRIGAHA
jgi:hypothetical protein